MKKINKMVSVALSLVLVGSLAGCGGTAPDLEPSYATLKSYISTISEVPLPTTGIIALGEATHGNREFTLLKLEVFRQIVAQSEIRAFTLEGDFGGCRKVNAYIQTGKGTAAEAASEIGFAIYRTKEMVEMLEWMRAFNTGKGKEEQIRFYGYDMQRYDNNKEGLFALLKQGAPELAAEYETVLTVFTDDTMFDLEESIVEKAIPKLEALNAQLAEQEVSISGIIGQQSFDLAQAYATVILENTRLRTAMNYGTLRDGYMAQHVQWIDEFEKTYYGAPGIFVAGHNGHIGKTTATIGTEKSMGQILSETLGDAYYSIGTEFGISHFLAPDDSGKRKEFTIKNKGDTRLAVLLAQGKIDPLFLYVDSAVQDEALSSYLQEKQPMSSIGEYFTDSMGMTEQSYTQSLSPAQTYDGLIYVHEATPSTMFYN